MSRKKVSVSIVGYNNRDILGDCLSALAAQSYPGVEAVYVDNASTDGSAEFVRESFPAVKVIANESNYHFCRGHNIGIGSTAGDYVLVLNTDVVMEPDFIAKLVAAMDSDAEIGSVSGKVLRTGGEKIDTTGLFLGRQRKALERGYGEPYRGQYDEPGYVFGAGGVSPLYRREMLEDIAEDGEYFDETFEAYYEDLDLAWRAHRRGWKAYYQPEAVAYHARGGTNKVEPPGVGYFARFDFAHLSDRMKARALRNRYLAIIKNDRPQSFLRDLPYIALYDLKLWAYVLVFAPGALYHFARGLGAFRSAWHRRNTRWS